MMKPVHNYVKHKQSLKIGLTKVIILSSRNHSIYIYKNKLRKVDR